MLPSKNNKIKNSSVSSSSSASTSSVSSNSSSSLGQLAHSLSHQGESQSLIISPYGNPVPVLFNSNERVNLKQVQKILQGLGLNDYAASVGRKKKGPMDSLVKSLDVWRWVPKSNEILKLERWQNFEKSLVNSLNILAESHQEEDAPLFAEKWTIFIQVINSLISKSEDGKRLIMEPLMRLIKSGCFNKYSFLYYLAIFQVGVAGKYLPTYQADFNLLTQIGLSRIPITSFDLIRLMTEYYVDEPQRQQTIALYGNEAFDQGIEAAKKWYSIFMGYLIDSYRKEHAPGLDPSWSEILSSAIEHHDLFMVRLLMEKGCLQNLNNSIPFSHMKLLVEHNKKLVDKFFVEQEFVTIISPLFLAMTYHDLPIFHALYLGGANLKRRNYDVYLRNLEKLCNIQNNLLSASLKKQLVRTKKATSEMCMKTYCGETVLHMACRYWLDDFINEILSIDPSLVDSVDFYGNTPIFSLLDEIKSSMRVPKVNLSSLKAFLERSHHLLRFNILQQNCLDIIDELYRHKSYKNKKNEFRPIIQLVFAEIFRQTLRKYFAHHFQQVSADLLEEKIQQIIKDPGIHLRNIELNNHSTVGISYGEYGFSLPLVDLFSFCFNEGGLGSLDIQHIHQFFARFSGLNSKNVYLELRSTFLSTFSQEEKNLLTGMEALEERYSSYPRLAKKLKILREKLQSLEKEKEKLLKIDIQTGVLGEVRRAMLESLQNLQGLNEELEQLRQKAQDYQTRRSQQQRIVEARSTATEVLKAQQADRTQEESKETKKKEETKESKERKESEKTKGEKAQGLDSGSSSPHVSTGLRGKKVGSPTLLKKSSQRQKAIADAQSDIQSLTALFSYMQTLLQDTQNEHQSSLLNLSRYAILGCLAHVLRKYPGLLPTFHERIPMRHPVEYDDLDMGRRVSNALFHPHSYEAMGFGSSDSGRKTVEHNKRRMRQAMRLTACILQYWDNKNTDEYETKHEFQGAMSSRLLNAILAKAPGESTEDDCVNQWCGLIHDFKLFQSIDMNSASPSATTMWRHAYCYFASLFAAYKPTHMSSTTALFEQYETLGLPSFAKLYQVWSSYRHPSSEYEIEENENILVDLTTLGFFSKTQLLSKLKCLETLSVGKVTDIIGSYLEP